MELLFRGEVGFSVRTFFKTQDSVYSVTVRSRDSISVGQLLSFYDDAS